MKDQGESQRSWVKCPSYKSGIPCQIKLLSLPGTGKHFFFAPVGFTPYQTLRLCLLPLQPDPIRGKPWNASLDSRIFATRRQTSWELCWRDETLWW
jgi:hypothetical protein